MGRYDYGEHVDFNVLEGKTITSIEGNKDSEILVFHTEDGHKYEMLHHQDCCESVSIEDIAGDLFDLLNSPILFAEEVSSSKPDAETQARRDQEEAEYKAKYPNYTYYPSHESETWTFYKLATIKGSVTIRWYGSSNGYYSESVSFQKASSND